MATEQNEGGEQATSNPTVGWAGMVEERFNKIKDHAKKYPYVWASYAVVYGGFGLWFTYRWRRLRKTEDRVRGLQKRFRGLWFTYRWRRLRKTEDRVRGLQKRLRELVEAEEAGSSAVSSAQKPSPPPSVDNKLSK